jgi:hypothetical protein
MNISPKPLPISDGGWFTPSASAFWQCWRGLILIAFGGITDKLIPLLAVSAFAAFTLSQAGMVVHWRRSRVRENRRIKMAANALDAIGTAAALVIIIVTKLTEGAWVTLLLVPGMLLIFQRVHRHYVRIAQEVERPIELKVWVRQPLTVVCRSSAGI